VKCFTWLESLIAANERNLSQAAVQPKGTFLPDKAVVGSFKCGETLVTGKQPMAYVVFVSDLLGAEAEPTRGRKAFLNITSTLNRRRSSLGIFHSVVTICVGFRCAMCRHRYDAHEKRVQFF
jgi:hypothetical protein